MVRGSGDSQVDAHLGVAPQAYLARLGRMIVDHDGHLGPLDVRGQALELLGPAVHLPEDVRQRPGAGLRGRARRQRAQRQAAERQRCQQQQPSTVENCECPGMILAIAREKMRPAHPITLIKMPRSGMEIVGAYGLMQTS